MTKNPQVKTKGVKNEEDSMKTSMKNSNSIEKKTKQQKQDKGNSKTVKAAGKVKETKNIAVVEEIRKLSEVDSSLPRIRLLSWNVNGARALIKKEDAVGFYKNVIEHPELYAIGLQEIKCDNTSVPDQLSCIDDETCSLTVSHSKEKKGYSGVLTVSKSEPLSVNTGVGHEIFDNEGRLITLEFDNFYYVTAYVPNSGDGLKRLEERCNEWESKLRIHLMNLDKIKPVIYAGDLNVACSEIELANPKNNYNKSAGFTQREIDEFDNLVKSGFTDAYRHFYPEEKGQYTYWGYRFNARAKNIGWRLDYFMVSNRLVPALIDVIHHTSVKGSDHCPIELQIDINKLNDM